MTRGTIRRWVQHHPFIPFQVKTASGDQYEAFHPDDVFLSESGRELTIWTKGMLPRVLDVFLISAIEQAE